MKVYLDDVRPKPADFDVKVTTAYEAIELLKTGQVDLISLDYDLGSDGDEGELVSNWIEEQAYNGTLKRVKVLFHTDNPVGRKRMSQAIENAKRFWDERGE